MAEIIIDQTDLNLTITPNTTQLNVFTGGYACAQGNTTEFQYNNGGVLAGANGLTYNSGTETTTAANLTVTNNTDLGDIGNITITGGNIGEVLQTDGAGGLSFGEIANANYANFAGTVLDNAQPNITSVGNLSNLTVTGNITANYFLGNGSQLTGIGDGTQISNGTSNVRIESSNGNVSISVDGNANILVANSTGITVTRANLGSASNLTIIGGNNGYFLQTDGTGNLTWAAGGNVTGNGVPGGANTQVQFNDGGSFGGKAGFTFNRTTDVLSVPGNVSITGKYLGDGGLLSNIAGGAFISNGNSNVSIATLNGNVTVAVNNTTTTTFANNVINVAVAINTNSQINSTVANGTAPLTVTSQTKVANLNADLLDGYNIATTNVANTVAVRDTNGNLSANYFIGNGSQLTGIDATAIQNGTANVRTFANANVTVSAAGNANILIVTGTGVNVAGTLNVTGNANLDNVGISNANIGNLTVSGTISANINKIANGTSNVSIPTTNGEIQFNVNGSLAGNINAAKLLTIDSLYVSNANATPVAATINGAFQVQGGNTIVKENILCDKIIKIFQSTGTAPLEVVSTTKVANLNADLLDGYDTSIINVANTVVVRGTNGNFSAGTITATLSGSATSANTAGTVTTAAQPNITSVGTLTGLTLAANADIILSGSGSNIQGANIVSAGFLSITNNSNLGNLAVANFFSGDGSLLTNLPAAANGNSYISIPVADGNIEFTVNSVSNTFVVSETGVYVSPTKIQPDLIFVPPNNNEAFTVYYDTANAGIANTYISDYSSFYVGNGIFGFDTLANSGNTITFAGNADGNVALFGTYNLFDIRSKTRIAAISGTGANRIHTLDIQPNIVNVRGDMTLIYGNVTANTGIFNGNGSGLSNLTGANVTGTVANATYAANAGNASTAVTATSANTAGTVTDNAQPNITSVGTLTSLTVSGNIDANFINAKFANGTSNIDIPTANGNINLSAGGNANILIVKSTGANITGTLDATANIRSLGNVRGNRLLADSQIVCSGGTATFDGGTAVSIQGTLSIDGNANLLSARLALGSSNALLYANGLITSNSNIAGNNISSTNYIKIGTRTVANLGNAVTLGAGTRSFVSDANTITFNAIVGGGGSNNIPVFSDGTDWRVG